VMIAGHSAGPTISPRSSRSPLMQGSMSSRLSVCVFLGRSSGKRRHPALVQVGANRA
jgi:hypothetical protein